MARSKPIGCQHAIIVTWPGKQKWPDTLNQLVPVDQVTEYNIIWRYIESLRLAVRRRGGDPNTCTWTCIGLGDRRDKTRYVNAMIVQEPQHVKEMLDMMVETLAEDVDGTGESPAIPFPPHGTDKPALPVWKPPWEK